MLNKDSSELASGDISLFGIEITLFDATDAYNNCEDGPCCQFGRFPWWNPVSNECICPVSILEKDCDCCEYYYFDD